MCLRLRLCPKASVYTEGEGRQKKEKGRDDDKCRGIYLEWSSRDGISAVPIPLTSIFTFAVASASIMSPQQAPLPSTTSTHPSPSHLFHPSSISVCSSLQNVMRQASRRKQGSRVLRRRGGVANGKNCPN